MAIAERSSLIPKQLGDIADAVWQPAVLLSFAVGLLRVNPIAASLPGNVWLALQLAPLVAAAALMALNRDEDVVTRRWRPVRWMAIALVSFCALSSLWSSTPFRTFSQSVVLGVGMTFLYMTATRRWASGVRRGDVNLFIGLGAGALLLGLVLRLGSVAATVGVARRFEGVAGNPNYLGMLIFVLIALIVVVLALDTSPRSRFIMFFVAGLGGIALIWSGSRGSILSLAVTVVIALFSPAVRKGLSRHAKTVVGATVVGAVVCAAVWAAAPAIAPPESTTVHMGGRAPASDSPESLLDRNSVETGATTGRATIWIDAVKRFEERPIAGIGFRSSEVVDSGNLTTHNLALSFLVETGVVGLALFLGLVVALLRAGWTPHELRLPLLAVVIGIVVQEQVEASLQAISGPIALLQWLMIFAFAAAGMSARRAPGQIQHDARSPA